MSQPEAMKQQFYELIDQVDDENVLTRHFGAISSEVNGETADF